jgi:uncharacterized protein with von Willebrand factor type A (vWA) domain
LQKPVDKPAEFFLNSDVVFITDGQAAVEEKFIEKSSSA